MLIIFHERYFYFLTYEKFQNAEVFVYLKKGIKCLKIYTKHIVYTVLSITQLNDNQLRVYHT